MKEWQAWERKCGGHGFGYGDGNGVWESGYEDVDMVMVEMGMKEMKRGVGTHVYGTLFTMGMRVGIMGGKMSRGS